MPSPLCSDYSSYATERVPRFTEYTSKHFFLSPIVNGSTELNLVRVATVLGSEEEHAFQHLPGESDNTMWPGTCWRWNL